MGENAAAQVGAEIVLHPARHGLAVRIGLGVGQQGLEVVLHDGIGGRGLATAVDGGEAVRPRGGRAVREGAAGSGLAGASRRRAGHGADSAWCL